MTREEAVTIIQAFKFIVDFEDYSDRLEIAIDKAIEALKEERPHGEWIPITYRPMDEEKYEEFRSEFGEIPIEDRKMFSCHMPEDDQEILICTSFGGVSQDRCAIDELYGYALETHGDWDGVIAWMPLPEPYKKEGDEE